MTTRSSNAAQLGADDVIRFLDAEHFLSELAGNLGRGRAFVRTRRTFEVHTPLPVQIEAPGVEWRVQAAARVVFTRDGYVGLEFIDFEDVVLPELDRLGEAAEASRRIPASDKTLVAPSPIPALLASEARARRSNGPVHDASLIDDLDYGRTGSAEVHIFEEDEEETGQFAILAADPAERDDPGEETGDLEELDENGEPFFAGHPTTQMEAVSTDALRRAPDRAEKHVQEPPRPAAPPPLPRRTAPRRPMPTDPPSRTAPSPDTHEMEAVRATPLADHDRTVAPEPAGSKIIKNPLLSPAPAPSAPPARTGLPAVKKRQHLEPSDLLLTPDAAGPLAALEDEPSTEETQGNLPSIAADLAPMPVETVVPEEESPFLSVSALIEIPPEIEALAAKRSSPGPFDAMPKSSGAPELAPPSPPPDPTPAAVVVPPPPPAPPSVPLLGVDSLKDRDLPIPRMTRGGVLRVTDEANLVGLWLSQLRHGVLTVFGGPEAEVGAQITIKISAHRVIALQAEVLARMGDWITLTVEDPQPIAEALSERFEAWKGPIESLAGTQLANTPEPEKVTPAPAVVIAPPPPPPAPVVAPPVPVAVAPEPAPAPEPEPEEVVPAKEEEAEEAGPARVPRLLEDRVIFARRFDLRAELDGNLESGGLFAESVPLAIRTKRRLSVWVGSVRVEGVHLDTEVVFADAGRVGFSVSNAAEARDRILEWLDGGSEADASDGADEASLGDVSSASDERRTEDFEGQLEPPAGLGDLLALNANRPVEAAGLAKASALTLLDYLVRENTRGVLDLETGSINAAIWFHGGSVAFVQVQPHDESLSLGRVLISLKKLNEGTLREGLERSKSSKKPLGRTLVLLGALKKADISAGLREQTRLLLDEVFTWSRGSYRWGAWREPPGESDLILSKGVGIVARYLKNRYETLNVGELEALLGKNMGRSVMHADDLDQYAGVLQLQPRELRFLEMQLDGVRTIHDAALGSPIGRLASLRLMAVCLGLGLVRFNDGGSRVVRERTRVGREPTAFTRIKKDLEERLVLFKAMNHFEVLGVHWSAHQRAYRAAYDKVKAEFNANQDVYKEAPGDVLDLLKKARNVLDLSYAAITDTDKRIAYRKQLFDKTERQYAADMLVKQGEVALMRGDRVVAMESLETAVELEPSQRNRALLASAREGRR